MVNFWDLVPTLPPRDSRICPVLSGLPGAGLGDFGGEHVEDSSLEQLRAFVAAAEMEFPVLQDVKDQTADKYWVRGSDDGLY